MLRHRIVRFGLAGTATTALHVVTAALLISLASFNVAVANGTAFLVATVFSCIANFNWTFRVAANPWSVVRFFAVSGILASCCMVIAQTARAAGCSDFTATLIVVIVIPLVSYVIHSRFTFS